MGGWVSAKLHGLVDALGAVEAPEEQLAHKASHVTKLNALLLPASQPIGKGHGRGLLKKGAQVSIGHFKQSYHQRRYLKPLHGLRNNMDGCGGHQEQNRYNTEIGLKKKGQKGEQPGADRQRSKGKGRSRIQNQIGDSG